MRVRHWISPQVSKGTVSALVLALVVGVPNGSSSRAEAQTEARLESTIFTYDGHDFVRTNTTLVTEAGKSAVNTKLDHDTPAYKALVQKHSYVGDATVFGRKFEADYAPLLGKDGQLTGALFVAVPK